MTILYFDALAGAGKTRALAREADRRARRGRKVLFVQPTKRLITNTIRDEITPLQPTYPVTPFHGDVVSGVIAALVNHFQTTRPGGEIVFTTHAAFLLVPYFENGSDWLLIMDEVPQVDVFKEQVVPESHRMITDHFQFEPIGAAYGRLSKREGQ